ncbi:MAG: hypothetical protein DDG59_11895 [Anaerolineae bacterium]|nr:MAG: hypothetical protein DDG59_11895 [Anaerolineae bacterium]
MKRGYARGQNLSRGVCKFLGLDFHWGRKSTSGIQHVLMAMIGLGRAAFGGAYNSGCGLIAALFAKPRAASLRVGRPCLSYSRALAWQGAAG